VTGGELKSAAAKRLRTRFLALVNPYSDQKREEAEQPALPSFSLDDLRGVQ
jgi:hypothetical protein